MKRSDFNLEYLDAGLIATRNAAEPLIGDHSREKGQDNYWKQLRNKATSINYETRLILEQNWVFFAHSFAIFC